ncbi:MAG: nicotinamide riboside transporter PnuC [Dysgonamonadaceae bacterium]|jgi:nicotinamide mononucleotide transporter|nr:nicotinamide riboside transporter PnuC [Dysgonamonadaceae bacterium]MDD3728615.1 nicotinamide riboside transporter PnuC [Dysgonamonadaceae bacterium]MDD4247172.1 nicotinamide riboside transporter PnuC [Dysgonamonadaceae bacterium]MDD4606161.1 nicotinamide riboside transporter PnuC [Dysgonamonadaceae bacterium]
MNIIEAVDLNQLIEIIAVVFGVLSVWYAHKENIWVFPLGIINVLIYIYICISARLYANAGINVVYFLTNVYGWYMWSRTNEDQESLQISRNTNKQNALWLLSAIILYGIIVWILRAANQDDPEYLNSILPWIDGLNTSFFLCATFLMALKKIENWLFWIAGNIISIPIYFSQELYFTSLQYAIFLVIAIMGWREWNTRWKERSVV